MKHFDSEEEWLATRRYYVTATEVGSVLGVNPYKSRNKLSQEKITGESDFVDNLFVKRGRELEDTVLEVCRRRFNVQCRNASEGRAMFFHERYRLSATPDAFLTLDNKDYVMECKTTGIKNLYKWGHETPPLYYIAQVHAQLMCCDKEDVGYLTGLFFGAPFPSLPMLIVPIKRSPELEALIIDEVGKFWDETDNEKKCITPSKVKKQAVELLTESILYDKIIYED